MANAELAGKILDAIEAYPEAFDIHVWYYSEHDDDDLRPDEDVSCGTALYVAERAPLRAEGTPVATALRPPARAVAWCGWMPP